MLLCASCPPAQEKKQKLLHEGRRSFIDERLGKELAHLNLAQKPRKNREEELQRRYDEYVIPVCGFNPLRWTDLLRGYVRRVTRARKQKELEKRNRELLERKLSPLSPEEERAVIEALNARNPHQVIAEGFRLRITSEDIQWWVVCSSSLILSIRPVSFPSESIAISRIMSAARGLVDGSTTK